MPVGKCQDFMTSAMSFLTTVWRKTFVSELNAVAGWVVNVNCMSILITDTQTDIVTDFIIILKRCKT